MVNLTSLRQEWLPGLPSHRLVINTRGDTDFGGKVDFDAEGGKPEYHSPGSNPGRSGGRRR